MQPVKVFFVFCLSLLYSLSFFPQAIDNTASFRNINADHYFRLHYENDFFGGRDRYYTQGINLETVHPSFKKFPLSKLLPAPKNSIARYGICLEHNGYTPTSIIADTILYDDRPYAAAVFLKNFLISNCLQKRYRITSSLSTGIIGGAAGGEWMQKTIHKWIHDRQPKGWQYQIKNDLVLNYETGIEKNILHLKNHLLLNVFAKARIGTLNDKLSTGFALIFGKINSGIASVFSGTENDETKKEKFSFHFYVQPVISAVAYDATLQGGLLNKKSTYKIREKNISPFTFQGNAGIFIQLCRLNLEYFQSVINKEFSTGLYHRWGGVRIGVIL